MGPFTEAELRDMQGTQERQPISDDRPPVNDGLPHHEFVPSEFAPESGRCDTCGGGANSAIHSKPVDQMARIADALEGILEVLTQRNDWDAEKRESGDPLQEIAGALHRIEDRFRMITDPPCTGPRADAGKVAFEGHR
jgi:hypothetical protein